MRTGASEDYLLAQFGTVYSQHRNALTKSLMQLADQEVQTEMVLKYQSLILRPWQRDVVDKLKDQDRREILFIINPYGNNGKTELANYLRATQNAFFT